MNTGRQSPRGTNGRSFLEVLEQRQLLAALYVDGSSVGPIRDGSSWATAYTDLQLALAAAADGDRILVADGTYKPTATADRTISFQLKGGVAILGGYAGYGAANPNARDVALYRSILSGDIGTPGNSSDNAYHVLRSTNLTSTAVLDGFTITAGNGAGDSGTGLGGGMYNDNSSPALTNCLFISNLGGSYGGAIYNSASSPTLANCTFIGNTAGAGGAIYNAVSSAPTLINCIFNGNVSGFGGGGAMYNSRSSPKLTNCIFAANRTSLVDAVGGAMVNNASSPTLTNCTFAGNVGAMGGAIGNYAASPKLTNCIVWGSGATPIYNYGTPSTVVATYSDIQGGYPGTGNIDADPLFVRPTSAGPDGLVATADDDYGDLRLRAASPSIDAGNNATPGLSGITTDLEGRSRFADVPSVANTGSGTAPIVDMGAYEAPAAIDAVAPAVSSVSINDGAVQRSMVNKLSVTFSEPVALSAGALQVKLKDGTLPPNITVTVTNPSGDQKTYTLTFSGTGATGGSLADGIYDLSITATGIQDLAGNPLTANFSQRFHRLFGDADGNRIINSLDYARLKQTFGRAPSDPLFNSVFDYEANNLINALDLARFRQRYGMSYSY